MILMRTYEEYSVRIFAEALAKDLCEGIGHTVVRFLSGYLYVTDTFAVADVSDEDVAKAARALFTMERIEE